MSLEAEALANEIVRLEALKADGHDMYIVYSPEEKPIGPRLRQLHKELAATGKGPIEREHKPNPSALPEWKTR